ncbi:DUF4185 domain-containing protein [Mycolicibacter arupensis]|jgi:hypothetical protein|uniref:DUF4185 domain-containing protein n=1 Tax=Mycolicibacter arupensis TaxID=342002 RepID=A0A0F5MZ69_9MYCO|nr:DUF4185 domain-containing protein [Mycolicibacter arupensis]KAA1430697.1 DUF4185 domain-containing protein [Mycolicibacter arupensis]KKC00066.1 hypothetical protein WR43_06780 [Mycolicibacter arupensis]MCV7275003.1 DUF4185 domain-containing protein [Mycolicibacter arupensis]OQZ95693.1 hypothetical protein BST15_13825 [Mycolicibacter arupensis]TXI51914.1 MAG: DUF4185 domain-containing protein [Mycolicibacter arupensis]
MSATRRIVSAAMVPAVVLGLVAATEFAPPAMAATCNAPEANIDPPPGSPTTGAGQLPSGRRPRGTNDQAPLPKLGPLIAALINPNGTIKQQAAVVPPVPNPAGQAVPNVAQPAQPVPIPGADPGLSTADPGGAIAGAQTSLVEWMTGPNSPNQTLQRFGVSGTDLGIPWDNGDPANRQVLYAFGDTFGYCRIQGKQWRQNVLFRSNDNNLADGITVAPGVVGNKYSGSPLRQANFSKQVLPAVQLAQHQEGMIPTAAIGIAGNQYMNFMSIKQWGRDGEWSTNYSAIAVSNDNGETWGVYPGTVRSTSQENVPRAQFVPGNEKFQMGAFLRGNDGYLYSYGTPSGRGGSAYLSRVPERSIPDLTKYQYWNGDSGSWVPANPAAATPVIPGPVGEMSVQYNTYLRQYLALYGNGGNDVVARTAPTPQGPWSGEQTLIPTGQIPGGIYAPYVHPWSTGKDVYFTLSLWNAYDVMLMHTVLG